MIPKSYNIIRNSRTLRLFVSRNLGDKKLTIEEKVAAMSPDELLRHTIKVSDWNKRLLVFSGRFKNVKDVPERLPFGTLEKERSKVRIKICNYMIVATAIGCIFMAFSGKRAAEAGETLGKQQLQLHEEYKRMRILEEAAAAAAAAKTA